MPQSTLSLRRVASLLSTPLEAAKLTDLLFGSKAELVDLTGDALKVEVTADRLDLLSEGGLGLYLAGVTGEARGLPTAPGGDGGPALAIHRDPSVAPLRPEIAGLVVDAPPDRPLDTGLLDEAVRFQELLHATVGRDRRLASLGIYPAEHLHGPLAYAVEPLDAVRFTPLDGEAPLDGAEFYRTHPLAVRYGVHGRAADGCLTFRDADGAVLSLPPVLNARGSGEARPGDRRLLLEATGRRRGRVQDALALLSLVFRARGWRATPVAVSEGGTVDDGRGALDPRTIRLGADTLRTVTGETIPPPDVVDALGRARLSARAVPEGFDVAVPPWRPDVLAEVDLVEEVVLARGLRADQGVLPPARTRGRRRPESRFRARVAAAFLGLGFVPLVTPVLVAARHVQLLGRAASVEVANPVSDQFSHLRDRLVVSLAAALEHNVRHGYPQRVSEVGPVLVRDADADAGAATRYHVGAVLASDDAGFADAAAVVEYLLGVVGTVGVREPAELPGTIPGRAARVRLAGVPVAEVGELHPAVLTELSVPVPVAWAELDLSALWPLVGAPQTP